MSDIEVRPETIHLAALQVDAAGEGWGESVGELTSAMGSVGDPYGADELGDALRDMYDTVAPPAFTYLTETGYAVLESAVALDLMAVEYAEVEAHNTDQAESIGDILDSLGQP